jgi:predicted heme/steroid binding protein
MEIKKLEEAKKYIGKSLLYPDVIEKKLTELFVGEVYLSYNGDLYIIEAFNVWEDKKYQSYWGQVKLKDIKKDFDDKESYMVYCFDKNLAEQYLQNQIILRNHSEKIRELNYAKEVFKKYKIKYEIFN